MGAHTLAEWQKPAQHIPDIRHPEPRAGTGEDGKALERHSTHLVCFPHTQAGIDGPTCPLRYKNAAISKTEKAFSFPLPFASLVRAVGRLSDGRERSKIGAVRMERQEGSEKFLPARSPGSSAGSWPTPTLLARIPALFGVPKGHSPLVTAALCLGNTSWDVLSCVSGADHSFCQATTAALSLRPSGPASLQEISEEKTTSQAQGSEHPGAKSPRRKQVPDAPPAVATPPEQEEA